MASLLPSPSKLIADGVHNPSYIVGDKTFYSKVQAINYCQEMKWEWPTFQVWKESQSWKRPIKNFDQSCATQVQLISDSHNKVRLWYSGGRDSGYVLECILKNKGKLDEIAVYRRFPGDIDNQLNEFDRFNILSHLQSVLAKYDRRIPIICYDLHPLDFKDLTDDNNLSTYFETSDLPFFGHTVYTVAQCLPELFEDGYVNLKGHAFPEVVDNQFYWIDTNFNLNHYDPFVINFFCDQRNPDVAVNLAYEMKDLQSQNIDVLWKSNINLKEKLNFPITNTMLDEDWSSHNAPNPFRRWVTDRKDIDYMSNANQTKTGRLVMDRLFEYYDKAENQYQKYLHNGNIYNYWIGSLSEKHTLVDN